MKQVYRDKADLTAHVLEGDSAFVINWSTAQAALGLGFPIEFFSKLQGNTLRADIDEHGVRISITDQQLEVSDLGKRLWDDLVAGFRSSEKEATGFRETYKFLWMLLEAGYSGGDVGEIIRQAEAEGSIRPQAWRIGSFKEIHDFVIQGGSMGALDVDLASLHLAAATIYYLILPPGTRNELDVRPEQIGYAATTRL